MSRIRSSFALLAGCAVAVGFGGTAALAADMALPSKAAPMAAAAPPPLDIHGFVEFDWESSLVNPQGQVLGTHGAESVVAGLNWTLWHGNGWINNITVGGLVAGDFIDGFQGYWALRDPAANGHFFDAVGQISGSVTFWQYWTLRESYTLVASQDVAGQGSTAAINCGAVPVKPGNACSGFPTLPINELRLSFNDSFTGWWITWNPYVEWYYNFGNFSAASIGGVGTFTPACFACAPNTSDFYLGIDPTVSMAKWWGVPLTLKAPTYLTVGEKSFWGVNGISNSNLGMFTTGLTAIWGLNKWITPNYGNWYIKGGFQWYDLINNGLVLSENQSVGCAINLAQSCNTSRSVWVGFVGIGATF